MQNQVETIKLRVTTKDIMDVKDAYSLYDTHSAIRFLFDQQHPTKEVLLESGFTSEPCNVDREVVVITVKARTK